MGFLEKAHFKILPCRRGFIDFDQRFTSRLSPSPTRLSENLPLLGDMAEDDEVVGGGANKTIERSPQTELRAIVKALC